MTTQSLLLAVYAGASVYGAGIPDVPAGVVEIYGECPPQVGEEAAVRACLASRECIEVLDEISNANARFVQPDHGPLSIYLAPRDVVNHWGTLHGADPMACEACLILGAASSSAPGPYLAILGLLHDDYYSVLTDVLGRRRPGPDAAKLNGLHRISGSRAIDGDSRAGSTLMSLLVVRVQDRWAKRWADG